MGFHDHFSGHAREYARFRPRYPAALFAYLATLPARRERGWDVGTGNGQVAAGLAEHFDVVVASDPSRRQLAHAVRHPNVRYVLARAEDAFVLAGAVDLVMVGQALHWFDRDRFFAVARRAVRGGGIVAVWGYALARVCPAVDALTDRLYAGILDGYWAAARRLVDDEYRGITFPFEEVPKPPSFAMEASLTLDAFVGYLGTWSAVRRYAERNGVDPVSEIEDALRCAWGAPDAVRPVRWPMFGRVGRVP